MATRNNSSPYILPRRTPNSARPGAIIASRNLSTLHIQPRPSPLSRTIPKPQPLRVVGRIIDPMTLGSSRQLFLAPASAVLSPPEQLPNVQPMVYDGFHQQRAPVFKLAHKELSEEDEFDVDEVYRLLDESAGFRAEEMGSPRRRERLTNLSLEEKINRRKHKNRIAAQAARDRKKVNTHRLEESLRGALLEIGRLRGEVNLLRADNARLEAENQTIRFGQEKPGPEECGDNGTFQRHLMDEPMLYEEHCLPQQQKSHRHFQHQSTLNRPQTADVKPSILVRGQQQPQQIGVIGQRDSVGSAASFHEPQQRERESMASSVNRSSGSPSGRPKWTEKRASAMACVAKVLMALWLVGKTSNCRKSLTNCSKISTFQSMLTASATKSLRKELLKRVMRLEPAKLAQLSNSRPKAAMAACIRLMRRRPKAKVRLRPSATSGYIGSSAESEEDSSSNSMELAVVPQLRRH